MTIDMTQKIKVRDLRPGNSVQCDGGVFVTVRKAYREAIFEGDVWCIETDDGNKWADSGNDKVLVAT
jgi:hypothetical protein